MKSRGRGDRGLKTARAISAARSPTGFPLESARYEYCLASGDLEAEGDGWELVRDYCDGWGEYRRKISPRRSGR